jgi:hypothetical protein
MNELRLRRIRFLKNLARALVAHLYVYTNVLKCPKCDHIINYTPPKEEEE